MNASPPFSRDDAFVMRQSVLDAIKRAETGAEAKRRILLARDLGLLADDETEEWIAMYGVQND